VAGPVAELIEIAAAVDAAARPEHAVDIAVGDPGLVGCVAHGRLRLGKRSDEAAGDQRNAEKDGASTEGRVAAEKLMHGATP
jgi:hypothetical protein